MHTGLGLTLLNLLRICKEKRAVRGFSFLFDFAPGNASSRVVGFADTICDSVNFDLFMANVRLPSGHNCPLFSILIGAVLKKKRFAFNVKPFMSFGPLS